MPPLLNSAFEFALAVAGLDEANPEDTLFEAGCDDALVTRVKGRMVLHFHREAPDFACAVASAIQHIRSAGGRVLRLEPDPLVTAAEIAARASLTRQAVANFIQGKRGKGFPPPVARILSESPLWNWREVAEWLASRNKLKDKAALAQALIIERLGRDLPAGDVATATQRRSKRRAAA